MFKFSYISTRAEELVRNGGCLVVLASEAARSYILGLAPSTVSRRQATLVCEICYVARVKLINTMCASIHITVIAAICIAVASGHVHGPRRSRIMDLEKAQSSEYKDNEIDSGRADESSWWPSAEIAVLQKVYDDCSEQRSVMLCLKGKALTAVSRAVEQVNYVQLVLFNSV